MATIEARRTTDGAPSYRVKIRLRGRPTETASFARLTDARRWAQSTEAAIREGRYFHHSQAKRHSLREAIDRYKLEVLPNKPASARSQSSQLNWWCAELGGYYLADITPAQIGKLRDKLLSTPRQLRRGEKPKTATSSRAPGTVVRYIAVLSHLFTIAIKEWGWAESSPVAKIRKPREPRGRGRFLSKTECVRLLETCKASSSTHLYPAVVLALSTGMRRGEIFSLQGSQIDLIKQRITIYKTKNGEIRVVPLMDLALELIGAMSKARAPEELIVFPGSGKGPSADIKKSWYTALEDAEIADFRFHDLRHTAASYLAMGGASLLEIAAVLGHKTLSMVKRYSHLSEGHTYQVVAAMNKSLFGKEDNDV